MLYVIRLCKAALSPRILLKMYFLIYVILASFLYVKKHHTACEFSLLQWYWHTSVSATRVEISMRIWSLEQKKIINRFGKQPKYSANWVSHHLHIWDPYFHSPILFFQVSLTPVLAAIIFFHPSFLHLTIFFILFLFSFTSFFYLSPSHILFSFSVLSC